MKAINFICCITIFLLISCSPKVNPSAGKRGDGTLRVMAYNIHHANPPSKEKEGTIDLDAIAAAISLQSPDLVALQEVDVNTKRSGGVNEAVILAQKLKMNFYFAKAIDHDGGDYGVAILSRFPMSEAKTFMLPKNSDARAEQRVLATAKIEVAKNKFIRFASTHLDAQKTNENRQMQAKEINRLLMDDNLPVVLGGDLNAAPGSESIKIFDALFTRTCQNCDFTIPVINPTKTIDHIGYKPANAFEVVSHKAIAEHYASDHLPILSVLQYKL
ncbi:endonuclease/exonuclease/phosphatase family protein [Pedobacter sandarakinus]|uniref:endonuclease/exonuclease/phosphatase family protein n=1 Tax=Pedobacter sandarakinus TaxID=353156 RepID=UPI0022464D6A|nr:endonuclease/exonuclease/phosphatase family protein [Pedobacter sandarakinus]MCX2575094.1 endonuclease/exonuclease/phosphatase family protein [Pedobacter sandarakinus]